MNILRQFRLELARLLQNRLTWLAILLTALAPIAGLTVYRPLYHDNATMQGMYLANPALAGGVLGTVDSLEYGQASAGWNGNLDPRGSVTHDRRLNPSGGVAVRLYSGAGRRHAYMAPLYYFQAGDDF